ncbi:hypothetical protein HY492_01970 [Candidatus Woesearchaeota archaeon]|nr:hypothetical protein [Candidatus Woesearchaeota archaeon]
MLCSLRLELASFGAFECQLSTNAKLATNGKARMDPGYGPDLGTNPGQGTP